MEREKVDLSGAPATMLATLYGRALHSRSADPILRDPFAEEAVRRLDHDFGEVGLRRDDPLSIALRANVFDQLTAERIAEHPDVTVLHLGCGLDSRGHRLELPPSVQWLDVDLPEVIELRRRICDEPAGHRAIAASATDPALLEQVPADRRVLVVAEGLSMYLDPREGFDLLHRITERFPAGDLVFDVMSPLAVRLGGVLNSPVRAAGARLRWGIRDGAELVNAVPRLSLDQELTYYDVPGLDRLRPAQRAMVHALGRVPGLRKIALILRMSFG